jgi:hypothetical protein
MCHAEVGPRSIGVVAHRDRSNSYMDFSHERELRGAVHRMPSELRAFGSANDICPARRTYAAPGVAGGDRPAVCMDV